ncbi:hypothetical protein [Fulvivirga lutea]|uniref:Uncharacterized protein n=1 Tax=Fulvivirga lutea TaxID=2810512 RepID=A0A974WFH5_9BACT|nr:hypothetical protein [Fulvivirga lutea]QSE96548.1 hypothetical protein JR347_13180 [Fulvivirga lutea]
MKLLKIHSGPFHRFGSRYGSMFDPTHLLGRGVFDDTWLVKKESEKENEAKTGKMGRTNKVIKI